MSKSTSRRSAQENAGSGIVGTSESVVAIAAQDAFTAKFGVADLGLQTNTRICGRY